MSTMFASLCMSESLSSHCTSNHHNTSFSSHGHVVLSFVETFSRIFAVVVRSNCRDQSLTGQEQAPLRKVIAQSMATAQGFSQLSCSRSESDNVSAKVVACHLEIWDLCTQSGEVAVSQCRTCNVLFHHLDRHLVVEVDKFITLPSQNLQLKSLIVYLKFSISRPSSIVSLKLTTVTVLNRLGYKNYCGRYAVAVMFRWLPWRNPE